MLTVLQGSKARMLICLLIIFDDFEVHTMQAEVFEIPCGWMAVKEGGLKLFLSTAPRVISRCIFPVL